MDRAGSFTTGNAPTSGSGQAPPAAILAHGATSAQGAPSNADEAKQPPQPLAPVASASDAFRAHLEARMRGDPMASPSPTAAGTFPAHAAPTTSAPPSGHDVAAPARPSPITATATGPTTVPRSTRNEVASVAANGGSLLRAQPHSSRGTSPVGPQSTALRPPSAMSNSANDQGDQPRASASAIQPLDPDAAAALEDQRRESWAAAAALDMSLTPYRRENTVGRRSLDSTAANSAAENSTEQGIALGSPQQPGLVPTSGSNRDQSPGEYSSASTAQSPNSALARQMSAARVPFSNDSIPCAPKGHEPDVTGRSKPPAALGPRYWLPETTVGIDERDGAVMRDTVSLIAGWLLDRGFTSTLNALRCEAGIFSRDEYLFRKALRSIAAAVAEGRWDAAHAASRGLFSTTVYRTQEMHREQGAQYGPTVPKPPNPEESAVITNAQNTGNVGQSATNAALTPPTGATGAAAAAPNATVSSFKPPSILAQTASGPQQYFDVTAAERRVTGMLLEQQLLEHVEAGDAAKAFSLFTKRLKPLEPHTDAKVLQNLLYVTTCRSVAEAAASLRSEKLARWSVEGGRAALIALIRNELVASHVASEGSFGDTLATDTYVTRHSIPVVPGQLHTMMEQAATYQSLRGMLASGALNLDAFSEHDRNVIEQLANPTRPPVAIHRLLKPVSSQLPPVVVLQRAQLDLNSAGRRQLGSVCRVLFDATTRRIIIGTSDGVLGRASFDGPVTAASPVRSPLVQIPGAMPTGQAVAPTSASVTLLGPQHLGAVTAIATPLFLAGKSSSGILLSTSLDGTARVWTPVSFPNGTTGYATTRFALEDTIADPSGFGNHLAEAVTAAALSPDGSVSVLADCSGQVTIWRTNSGAEPSTVRHNRHCREPQQQQQQQQPPTSGLDTDSTLTSAPEQPSQLQADPAHPVPTLLGTQVPIDSLEPPLLLSSMFLDPLRVPPAGGTGDGAAGPGHMPRTQSHYHEATSGTRAAARGVPSWGFGTVVSIVVARHGLTAFVLQKSGVVTTISTAIGKMLRRFPAPESSSSAADASCFAVSNSGLHAFVGLGSRGDVRLLSIVDGMWRPDVFRVAREGSKLRPTVTCVALSDDDAYLLVGSSDGHVAAFCTIRPRLRANASASDPPLAADESGARYHLPDATVRIGDAPVCDLRPVDRVVVDSRRAFTMDGGSVSFLSSLLSPSTAPQLAADESFGAFARTGAQYCTEEARRYLATTTAGEVAFLCATSSGLL
jgi:hypothetical protein